MATALSASFRDRLERMELDRNKRLSLLQAERELQASKSLVLASKLAGIREMERRCSMLDQKIASQSFKISLLKSEIDNLNAKYDSHSLLLRALMSEVEDLQELEKAKDEFYDSKGSEMKEFKHNVERFVSECRVRLKELKNGLNKLQSSFVRFQDNNGYSNSEIDTAEMMKSGLLAAKQDLDKNLASNYRMKAHLQTELQSILSVD
ncbi:hypothetical protein L484_008683 [Morus notabilis]|uniref:Uncharacterized protein n=1 Tax=Morus notabilis TaxID=981085 RepID=W9RP01_9ROSA|nr:cingulin [Morus notabilis]EXB62833.1 hypothetical protein L484_008683 [Morus notabilis]